MAIVLIGGGTRSGKSTHALRLARERGKRLGFIATAEIYDQEMRDRVDRHRSERGREFITIDAPTGLAEALQTHALSFDALVVDCLTLWASNLLLAGTDDIPAETARVIGTAASMPFVVFVTNEVGCGIVPDNALARQYRDLAGRMNQDFAEAADEVYWMAFGCPLKVKG